MENNEELIDSLKASLKNKESTVKKFFIVNRVKILHLKNFYNLNILYEKLNDEQTFLSKNVFYIYMRLISSSNIEVNQNLETFQNRWQSKQTKKKEVTIKNTIGDIQPIKSNDLDVSEEVFKKYKLYLKSSDYLAKRAIEYGLDLDFIKREFNTCTSLVQATDRMNQLIKEIENGNI